MIPLERVLAGAASAPDSLLLPPDAALESLPQARLDAASVDTLRHGQAVRVMAVPAAPAGRRVRLYGPEGEFLGLAEAMPDGRLQPRRLLVAPPGSGTVTAAS
jgi:tRNA pseudouridine55 synthase